MPFLRSLDNFFSFKDACIILRKRMIILRYHTKHDNFELGVQYTLKSVSWLYLYLSFFFFFFFFFGFFDSLFFLCIFISLCFSFCVSLFAFFLFLFFLFFLHCLSFYAD